MEFTWTDGRLLELTDMFHAPMKRVWSPMLGGGSTLEVGNPENH
jgi:hypothetical protein